MSAYCLKKYQNVFVHNFALSRFWAKYDLPNFTADRYLEHGINVSNGIISYQQKICWWKCLNSIRNWLADTSYITMATVSLVLVTQSKLLYEMNHEVLYN